MASRRRTLLWLLLSAVVAWNFLFFVRSSWYASPGPADTAGQADAHADVDAVGQTLRARIERLQSALHDQSQLHMQLLDLLRKEGARLGEDVLRRAASRLADRPTGPVLLSKKPRNRSLAVAGLDLAAMQTAPIPVLVMACNRVTVRRSLDLLLRYRPSRDLHPIIVSQDCGHAATAAAIASYGSEVVHIRQPDLTGFNLPVAIKRFEGYYKISRHYKWALDQIFLVRNHSAVIIVEDDLEVSPDFFEYFRATYPILRADASLFCVSAWNDNGKANLIADNPLLLHRTDFFPGLGWMLLRELWLEIRSKWPGAFWDEYMRRPEVRHGRACIQPEVSRSSTFGRIGVSNGQFFDKHLKYIRLNQRFVAFTKKDMSYLMRTAYDANFEVDVYSSPELRLEQVLNGARPELGAVRLTYNTKDEFKSTARRLGIMDDFKAGVPRTAYRGVVSIFFRHRRVYVAPRRPWKGYNVKWT